VAPIFSDNWQLIGIVERVLFGPSALAEQVDSAATQSRLRGRLN
jgi:hypothetical protein